MTIALPPKLYLDTNHLCCIANLRRGASDAMHAKFRDAYTFINTYIAQGRVGLILQLMSPLEWAGVNATLQSANELADLFDSAPLSYHVESDTIVYTAEVLNECRRMDPRLIVPHFDLFWCRDSSFSIQPGIFVLSKLLPDVFPLSESATSTTCLPSGKLPLRLAVERAFNLKNNKPELLTERVNGFAAAMANDLDAIAKRNQTSYSESDFQGWAVRYLSAGRILKSLNPTIDGEQAVLRVRSTSPDFKRHCPATSLFLNYRLKKLRTGQPAKDGDVGDAEFLQVVPFADLVLTDRCHRHFIVAAEPEFDDRVYSDPNDFVARLRQFA